MFVWLSYLVHGSVLCTWIPLWMLPFLFTAAFLGCKSKHESPAAWSIRRSCPRVTLWRWSLGRRPWIGKDWAGWYWWMFFDNGKDGKVDTQPFLFRGPMGAWNLLRFAMRTYGQPQLLPRDQRQHPRGGVCGLCRICAWPCDQQVPQPSGNRRVAIFLGGLM